MTMIGSVSSAPVAQPTDHTFRTAATVAIRLVGALTVFAGLILTTQAFIATGSMIYWQRTELLSNVDLNMELLGGMTVFSTLGSALVVVVWGMLLTAVARPLGRFVGPGPIERATARPSGALGSPYGSIRRFDGLRRAGNNGVGDGLVPSPLVQPHGAVRRGRPQGSPLRPYLGSASSARQSRRMSQPQTTCGLSAPLTRKERQVVVGDARWMPRLACGQSARTDR